MREGIIPKPTEYTDPFRSSKRRKRFNDEVYRLIREKLQSERKSFVPDENSHSYRHGGSWNLGHQPTSDGFTQFSTARGEATIRFEDIVNHNTQAVSQFIAKMTNDLQSAFMAEMLQVVERATVQTGNQVKWSGNTATDILDMLSRMELGCDRFGKPSMPVIHANPATAAKVFAELEKQPQSFRDRFEVLQAQKEKEAIGREADRLQKFRWAE